MSKIKLPNFLQVSSMILTVLFLMNVLAPLFQVIAVTVEPPKSKHLSQIVVPAPGGTKVNTWNGNMFYSIPLISLSGRGIPVSLSLNYNSSWNKNSSNYGYGWQFGYNIEYTTNSNGDFIVTWEDGRSETFINNGGNYVPSVDTFDSLTQYESGKFRLKTKNNIQYYFEDSTIKKITRIVDQYNNTNSFSYNQQQLLSTITDASSRAINLNYSNSKLTQIIDANVMPNRTINIQYDSNGNLSQITNFQGNNTIYTYNSDHYLIKVTDISGSNTSLTYVNGIIANIISDQGPSMYVYYDSTNLTTKVVYGSNTNNLFVTKYYYDSKGRIQKQERYKDADGNVITEEFAWDSNDNLLSFKDENGNTTSYTYDSLGNILTVADPENNVTTYTYEPTFNNVASVTNALGKTMAYQYDTNGNLVKSIDPLNNETTYTYAANGDQLATVNANGKTVSYTYDSNGYQTQATDPLNHSITNTYDSIGNLISTEDSAGNTTTFTYDVYGHKLTETNALGKTTQYEYDSRGNLVKKTDANNKVTNYFYNNLNQIIKQSDNDGASITFTYDQLGNLITTTDPKGNSKINYYDNLGRLIKEKNALGNVTTYVYDAIGNLTSTTDFNGKTIKYSYNSLNQLTFIDYPDNNDITYTYDKLGNKLSESNPNATVTYTYDDLSRIISEKTITGSITKIINYSYDSVGNKITMQDGEGGITTYAYDDANKLTSIKNPKDQVTTLEYDNSNRVIKKTLGNGTSESYTYDNANELLTITNKKSDDTVISSISYTYDSVGNRTTMNDSSGTTTYIYDNEYRLKKSTYPNGTSDVFTYDSVGNRTKYVGGGVSPSYSYDSNNQLIKAGRTTYSWDKNGNLTSKTETTGKTTYSYDARNSLTKTTFSDNTVNQFSYYPDGRRLSTKDKSGKVTYFFYDGPNVLSETDATGNVNTRYTSISTDQWLSQDQGDNSYFYLSDGLGSVSSILDSNQDIKNTYTYEAFGTIKSKTENVANRFTYTGRELDKDTGLYYYRARYYDSTVGRFTQQDPVKSVNLYTYVHNNPIILTDPSGRYPQNMWDYLVNYSYTAGLVSDFKNKVIPTGIGVADGFIPFGVGGEVLDIIRYDKTNKYYLIGKHSGTITSSIKDIAELVSKGSLTFLGSEALGSASFVSSFSDVKEAFSALREPTKYAISELKNLSNNIINAFKSFANDPQVKDQTRSILNSLSLGMPHVSQVYAADLSPNEQVYIKSLAGARGGNSYAVSVVIKGQEYVVYQKPDGQIVIDPVDPGNGGGGTQPASPQVILYGDSNYSSERIRTIASTNDPNMGASYKSLAIPIGWSVILKDKPLGFVGHNECFHSSQPNLESSSGLAANKSIDSMEVYTYDYCPTPPPNNIIGVDLCNQTGHKGCTYNVNIDIPSMADSGFGDNNLRSLYLGNDYEVVLFEHGNYEGASKLISSDQNDLGGLQPFGYGTSSMRIRRKTPAIFTLYSMGNFNGSSFSSDRPIENLENWVDSAQNNHSWGDYAQSIRVANGYEIIVCEDQLFNKRCARTTHDVGDLNELNGLRNAVSSVQICKDKCPVGASVSNFVYPQSGTVFPKGTTIPFYWQGFASQYTVKITGGALSNEINSEIIFNNQQEWKKIGLAGSPNPYKWQLYAWNPFGNSNWTAPIEFYIQDSPPSSVSISGKSTRVINADLKLTATVKPVDAPNINYVWSPEPKSGQGTSVAIYNFPKIGTQSIKVTAQNNGGSVSATKNITINCGSQYTGQYYNNKDLQGDVVSDECVDIISKDWGDNGPQGSLSTSFGDGRDGALTINQNTVDNPIDAPISGYALKDTNTINATNSNFAAGQKLLIIQSQGTSGVGIYQINEIVSYNSGVITVKDPLNNSYATDSGNRAQVMVVRQYTNVTVNSGVTWTAKPWNGSTGGILLLMAKGTVQVNGTISANAAGYRGGSATTGSNQSGRQGESFSVGTFDTVSSNANLSAGGGGGYRTDGAGSGGGGAGYSVAGSIGSTGHINPGQGGSVAGDDVISKLLMGSGGGSGGASYASRSYGAGGRGGGVINIMANNIQVNSTTGKITSNGQKGFDTDGHATGAGGGGAGGSIVLKATTLSLGDNKVNSLKGDQGIQIGSFAIYGGNGSPGRIAVEYCDSYNGTTAPQLNITKINCPRDNFSAQWTKTVVFEEATYQFDLHSDDGTRVWLDNSLIIDAWSNGIHDLHPRIPVAAGTHTIKVQYFEGIQSANINFNYQKVVENTFNATYFNNLSFTAPEAYSENTDTINYIWPNSPNAGVVNEDGFSVRWEGDFNFPVAGAYTFIAKADDGMRVWVDNTQIINAWMNQSPTEYRAKINLNYAPHHIKVEYYDSKWGAVANLNWSQGDQPFVYEKCDVNMNDQYCADYFNSVNLSGTPVVSSKKESLIDYNWYEGSPGYNVYSNNFTARWSGKFNFPQSGTYNFTIDADYGIRAWIDGVSLIDKWNGMSGPIIVSSNLGSGVHDVKVEYLETSKTANVKFIWDLVPNNAPVVSQIPDQTIIEGESFTQIDLNNYVSDPDITSGDSISWTYSGNSVLNIVKNDSLVTISNPNNAIVSENITFTATDKHLGTASSTTKFTVKAANFTVDYFNNKNLSGSSVYSTNEDAVDHDWVNGGPGNGVNNDNFSARWQKTLNLVEGIYTFNTVADDGIRLWIDNNLVIDNWVDQSTTTRTYIASMNSGNHPIKIEYYENGGGAVAKFSYEHSCLVPNSFCVDYFNNKTLTNPKIYSTNENSINHNWEGGGPGNGVANDNFSGRWIGSFDFTPGNHTFTTVSDDGVRLWVDNSLVIDNWTDHGTATNSGTINLSNGKHLVRVEYYENGGGAILTANWN